MNEYIDVSICLIDIVGFSKWCFDTKPKKVAEKMVTFNDQINNLLVNHQNLTKIELVGDSCLIVGGMSREGNSVVEMLRFCHKLITITTGFSFRVGIHIGDVYGAYLLNPKRFQMFGNAINIASRLQSSSPPGVIHVSKSVYDDRLGDELSDLHLDFGNVVTKNLKGVGDVHSSYITIKKNAVLIVEDLRVCQIMIKKTLDYKAEVEFCHDMQAGIQRMKENMFNAVLMDTHFGHETIFEHLEAFRIWETSNRHSSQQVIAVSANRIEDPFHQSLFNAVLEKKDLSDIRRLVQLAAVA